MSHPVLNNNAPFSFETAFLVAEDGQPLFVPIIKGTFAIKTGLPLQIAEEQIPINFAGEYWSNPDTSSYRYEPECAFFKPATDCVLIGSAYPDKAGATEVLVGFRVGPLQKVIKVFGDRFWINAGDFISMTNPRPIEHIPLTYERAFGGWDRAASTEEKPKFEPRNPVGIGFRDRWNPKEEAVKLPNLEDPRALIKSFNDRPPPAGFGFTSPNWQPRASLAGTYDEKWMTERMPLLPKDFDRRFFNAASPGLVAPGYLKGDEPVNVVNASPQGRISFHLPGVAPPRVHVELRGRRKEVLQTNLDTVIVNTDENLVILIWRAHLVIREVPQDIVAVVVESEGRQAPIR